MRITQLDLEGVFVIEPESFGDHRGYFMETMRVDRLRESGIVSDFVQENQSGSRRGTLRGLHFQFQRPQAKLCRVVAGEVLDIAVDIRVGSPNFGKACSVVLSAENRKQIYIPRDFAHGFVVLSEFAEFLYKCDDYYDPGDQRGIAWDDPELAIDWMIKEAPLLSEKDRQNLTLRKTREADLPVYDRR